MSDLQSQDYIRRSASTLTPPSVRRHEDQVAKLIDVSRCIGCKACQCGVHGMETTCGARLAISKGATTTHPTSIPTPGR